MTQKIRSLLYTLGCKRTHDTENPLHMITNQGVRFIVLKSEHGYEICEDELHPEPFRFGFCLKEDLTIQDVGKTIDLIHALKSKYEKNKLNERYGKESQSISNVETYAICKKLRELGVEIIEVYPDKIEFEWLDHICKYEKHTFCCGTKGMLSCENISDLKTIDLDCLVGKLTEPQLYRVGNLIDLFESDINHCLNQKEDLEYLEMEETPFYRINNEALETYTRQVKKLKKTLQTGFLEEFKSSYIKTYILLGKGIIITGGNKS